MNKPLLVLWSILSLIISGLFIFNGLLSFQLEELPILPFLSAFISMAYGLATVYLLSLSWTKPGEKLVTITKNIVIAMLITQIALNLDIATTGGFEWAGLLLLAIMLGTNWLAVKYVATYKKA